MRVITVMRTITQYSHVDRSRRLVALARAPGNHFSNCASDASFKYMPYQLSKWRSFCALPVGSDHTV
jgi:hypothetical protein